MAAWDDRKTWRARKATQETFMIVSAAEGQVWRDEDGHRWRITKMTPEWIWVTDANAPAESIQTHPGWLTKWTRES